MTTIQTTAAPPAAATRTRPSFPRRHRAGLITTASILVVLVFWEVVGRQMNPIFASYPTAIVRQFGVQLKSGLLIEALFDSLQPLLLGFFVAALIGVPVGLLVGRYRAADAALGVYVTAGYAMPLVALIPLFMLWFGLGFTVKVVIVVVMTVFPVVINTRAGVRAVPRAMTEVGTSFMATEFAVMRKIILPATVPHIMTGLRLGIGRAVIAIVIAEFFTAIGGLGGQIILAGQRFDTAGLFVPVIVLMALGVGLTRLVGWLETKVAPWADPADPNRD
ncbi:NitT/TauT family transport system permease protein [Amycolatopsis pretoriensis]|uniref:NitT/TauT family transport system permease protein n=1 Tax=Amycolatopsis pretoriensis TaxID=218821 RepID=A0A1H5R3Q4_9PSEU|nr:ABC transporter permease [Amycolatopsis pretoriensis]SEF32188.1 NitT/TauT family transport system permease protein [Amycolatopsis pretoriensis]